MIVTILVVIAVVEAIIIANRNAKVKALEAELVAKAKVWVAAEAAKVEGEVKKIL